MGGGMKKLLFIITCGFIFFTCNVGSPCCCVEDDDVIINQDAGKKNQKNSVVIVNTVQDLPMISRATQFVICWCACDSIIKEIVARAPHLSELCLTSLVENTLLTDEGIQAITTLKRLKSLHFGRLGSSRGNVSIMQNKSGCFSYISENGFKMLAELKNVNEMSFEHCLHFTDHVVRSLSSIPNLVFLTVVHSPISGQTLPLLKNLRVLNISNCPWIYKKAFDGFKLFKKLEALNCSHNTWLSDEVLYRIFRLPVLRVLCLAHSSGFSDDAFLSIQYAHQLEVLDLSYCKRLTDRSIAQIVSTEESLRSLSLEGCSYLSEDALAFVGYMTKLHYVNLAYTRVTDNVLEWLHHIEDLRELTLAGCRHYSFDGLANLLNQVALKKIVIHAQDAINVLLPFLKLRYPHVVIEWASTQG